MHLLNRVMFSFNLLDNKENQWINGSGCYKKLRRTEKSSLEICFSSLLSYMLYNCSLGTKVAEIEKITTRANDFNSHEGITLETSPFQILKCWKRDSFPSLEVGISQINAWWIQIQKLPVVRAPTLKNNKHRNEFITTFLFAYSEIPVWLVKTKEF